MSPLYSVPKLSMWRVFLLLLPAATAAPATAQSTILPARAAVQSPPPNILAGEDQTFAGSVATHTQHLWDSGEIPFTVATWTSVQFRPPPLLAPFSSTGNPPATLPLTITLSSGSRSFVNPSPTFANNLGALTTVVFAGTVNLPAAPAVPVMVPPPWTPPIVFTSPFLFVAPISRSLVVDLLSGPSGTKSWWLEKWTTLGEYAANLAPQTGCKFRGGGYHHAVQLGAYPFAGQPWNFGYSGLPPGTPGFAALGAVGVGSTWNGALLPIDLTALGAPGCALAVSIDATLPVLADVAGAAKLPMISMPPSPQLDGQVFFDQGIFLDANANALGIVTGMSSFWRIGGPRSGTRVFTSGSNAHTATTGTVDPSSATTMRFN